MIEEEHLLNIKLLQKGERFEEKCSQGWVGRMQCLNIGPTGKDKISRGLDECIKAKL